MADASESQDLLDCLPLSVGFAAAALDGVMEVEHEEIQKWWATVRAHLIASAALSPQVQRPGHDREK